jgi:hypothetical protein
MHSGILLSIFCWIYNDFHSFDRQFYGIGGLGKRGETRERRREMEREANDTHGSIAITYRHLQRRFEIFDTCRIVRLETMLRRFAEDIALHLGASI